jgi:hypothetical protein
LVLRARGRLPGSARQGASDEGRPHSVEPAAAAHASYDTLPQAKGTQRRAPRARVSHLRVARKVARRHARVVSQLAAAAVAVRPARRVAQHLHDPARRLGCARLPCLYDQHVGGRLPAQRPSARGPLAGHDGVEGRGLAQGVGEGRRVGRRSQALLWRSAREGEGGARRAGKRETGVVRVQDAAEGLRTAGL